MTVKILFYILIIFEISPLFSHRCGTDLLIKKLNLTANQASNKINRRRLSGTFNPINILIDYTTLKIQKNQGILSENSYQKFKTELDKIADYFKKIVYVQHENFYSYSLKSLINMKCDSQTENIDSSINSYDLIVFPQVDSNGEYLSNGVIAAASHCLASPYTGRPIAGIVILNKNLNSKRDIEYYIRNSIFHEFFHILGFNTMFFTQSYKENSYTYLNSPKLLEKAKIHFGCDTLKGLRLEDQGGSGTAGSHWDARYMQGELMIGEDYSEVVMSDMTLAYLEDLGFYEVNYYTGGLFRFGKNEGCSFFNKKCIYGEGTLFPNEFCYQPNEPFCSGSLTSKGSCFIAKYTNSLPEKYRYFSQDTVGGKIMTDYCPISFYSSVDSYYNYPTNCIYGKKENSDEIIGSNSICFKSSINLSSQKSICYKVECDRVNKQIKVIIGGNTVTCNGEKNEMTNPNGLGGSLLCPDYNMVCTSDIWCNNMYDCIDKGSTTDESTFYYNSNKAKLLQFDNKKLSEDDSSKYNLYISGNNDDGNDGFNIKYEWSKLIRQFALLIINFM